MKRENILAFDRSGVIHTGRTDLDPDKQRYARDTEARTLEEIVRGADIFLGLSAGGILKPEMVASMAERPIILIGSPDSIPLWAPLVSRFLEMN